MNTELLDQIKNLASEVRKSKAVNINAKAIKQAAISAGSYYFKNCRAEANGILGDEASLTELDEDWQQLIRLAHGNNAKKSYLSLLKRLFKKTADLTVAMHVFIPSAAVPDPSKLSQSAAEGILISTLDQLLPSAAQSYRQGLDDLNPSGERFSYRGTACEFRETLRETLDFLAPDQDVTRQSWFKQEANCNGPTMKQKVRFILTSRGKSQSQRSSAEKSVDLVDSLCGDIARAVYNRASVSTHVRTTKQEVVQMKRYLDAVLFDVLEIGQKE